MEFTEIELEGKQYRLAFDLGAMARAEALANKAGADLSVLRGVDISSLKLDAMIIFFACSLQAAQPELSYEDAVALAKRQKMKSLGAICEGTLSAWVQSMGTEDAEKNGATGTGKSSPSAESSTGSTCGALPDTTPS